MPEELTLEPRLDYLELLADVLEGVPTDKFDYNEWVGSDWGGRTDLSCGTTACGLGWATTIPELQDAGLYLDQAPREAPFGTYVRFKGKEEAKYVTSGRVNKHETSLQSAMAVFNITRSEAVSLFMNSKGLEEGWSAPEVALVIRGFIEEKKRVQG